MPLLGHWLVFLPNVRQSEIGSDGHPKRGVFLPPIHDLPRRMWAGSRISFPTKLRVGENVSQRSTILSVKAKNGASGPLVFVTVRHEISNGSGAPAIIEEQDIVYRGLEASAVKQDVPPVEIGAWQGSVRADPVMLFRYSALTFNSHRIHYDRDYATQVEGYPGLVVQGPLIAMLLLDLIRRSRPELRISTFSFRSVSPLFDGTRVSLNGKPPETDGVVRLWASSDDGRLVMTAEAAVDEGPNVESRA